MPQSPRDYITTRMPARLELAASKLRDLRSQMDIVNTASSIQYYTDEDLEAMDRWVEEIGQMVRKLQRDEFEVAEENRRWRRDRQAERSAAPSLPATPASLQATIQRRVAGR